MKKKLQRSKTTAPAAQRARPYFVNAKRVSENIIRQEDTTGTRTITIEDTGPMQIQLETFDPEGIRRETVTGTYNVSNLLQELALADESSDVAGQHGIKRTHTLKQEQEQEKGPALASGVKAAAFDRPSYILIDPERINEDPLKRLLRRIKTSFWPALIRSIDRKGLKQILADPKHGESGVDRLYVPFHDTEAHKYFAELPREQIYGQGTNRHLEVVRLPKKITPQVVKKLNKAPGILCLGMKRDEKGKPSSGFPFVVAGGRFNEMYGWDSYFCLIGYSRLPEFHGLALSVVNNFVYEIENYGKVLNGNRTYYLTRTQPPFFAEMLKIAARHSEKKKWNTQWELASPLPDCSNSGPAQGTFLQWIWRGISAAIAEYQNVWMNEPRYVPELGLSRYYDEGIGMPPETEPGHFDNTFQKYADRAGLSLEEYIRKYDAEELSEPELDAYFISDRAMRETGHDTTYRFVGITEALCTIDLNALLYRYETTLAELLERYFDGRFEASSGLCYSAASFRAAAARRKEKINQYMWNEEKGLYFDYNFVRGKQHSYETVTAYWALWAGLASQHAAAKLADNLEKFEMPGGLACGTLRSRGMLSAERPSRQWDYPIGWAPHQVLAWEGLARYGYKEDAKRLSYRWLHMVVKEFFGFNGVIPEKYDVVHASHKVEMEYGNVGTDFEYVAREGFGWVNSSVYIGLDYLSDREKNSLSFLISPEDLQKFIK